MSAGWWLPKTPGFVHPCTLTLILGWASSPKLQTLTAELRHLRANPGCSCPSEPCWWLTALSASPEHAELWNNLLKITHWGMGWGGRGRWQEPTEQQHLFWQLFMFRIKPCTCWSPPESWGQHALPCLKGGFGTWDCIFPEITRETTSDSFPGYPQSEFGIIQHQILIYL